ncbi:hypothetical protein HXX76_005364 [Chlamydomonas incerta]|uniref:NrS-1 polymerase-like helicase domain-containing protein n=1 Tax=Chlamydomonas incerta TaxID=51695 RepID=A0A835W670_CHLIN|nr:hypothetical protein HXX76_005364 [Chlamydomonas incerta]|eukprot:KAG2438823.1 hypothetical protein HXX76_005364 [Chlamydomonas incerta]
MHPNGQRFSLALITLKFHKYYKRGEVEDPTRFNLAFMSVPCSKWGYDDFTAEETQSTEYMRFEEVILNTIREQVCDGDETAYTYLMNWLVHNVQCMGEKMGTMVWLVGEQGTGKGWVFWTMGQLLGKAYVRLSSLDQLTAKFNAHLVGRALVLVDEACFNGSNAQADLIKNAVTEREILMESKFKDAEVIASTFNLCTTSNHHQPVKVENQDRRHALFKTSSLTNRGPEYWVPWWEASSDPVMLRFLYRHLMNRDVWLWNPRAIPNTHLRAAAQRANRPFIAWFLEEAVVEGWALRWQLQEEESVQVLRRSLYEAYNNFLDKQRERFAMPEAERPKSQA